MFKKSKADDLDLAFLGDPDATLDYNADDNSAFGIKTDNKPRSPIANFSSGLLAGMKGGITNQNTVKALSKNALPKKYGKAIDHSVEAYSEAKYLYNDMAQEIKPNLISIARSTEKLVPPGMRRTKGFLEKIRNYLGDYGDSVSNANQDQSEIDSNLSSIFVAMAEQEEKNRAYDKAEGEIQEQTDLKRFNTNLKLLSNISYRSDQVASYTTKVTPAYQKKSLELQFRTYFATRDLLEETRRNNRGVAEMLKAITKNTALPDYAKLTTGERIKDRFKNQLTDMAGKSLFGNGDFIRKGFDNIRSAVKDKVDNLNSIFTQAAMGMEIAGSFNEARQQMVESGDETATAPHMFGEAAGQGLMESLAAKFGRAINKRFVSKDGKIVKIGNTINRALQDPRNALRRARTSDFFMNSVANNSTLKKLLVNKLGEDKAKELLADESKFAKFLNGSRDFLAKGIDTFIGDKSLDDELGLEDNIYQASSATSFRNRTRRTIEEIIPGYLSRIFREIQVLRTGNMNIQLTEYDLSTSKFSDKGDIKKGIMNKLRSTFTGSGDSDKAVADVLEKLIGNNEVSGETRQELLARIKDSISNDEYFDIKHIKSKAFSGSLSKNGQSELSRILESEYGSQVENVEDKEDDLNDKFNRARDSYKNISGDIQALIDSGHGEKLIELGIVTKQNGKYRVNQQAYRKLMDKPRVKVTPDKGMFKSTPESDTVAATLTPDEFVVNAGATNKIGEAAMDIINSANEEGMTKEKLLEQLDKSIPHFAKGGRIRKSSSTIRGLVAPTQNEPSSIVRVLKEIKSDTVQIAESLNNRSGYGFSNPFINTNNPFANMNNPFSNMNMPNVSFKDMSIKDIYAKGAQMAGRAYDSAKDQAQKALDFGKAKYGAVKDHFEENKEGYKDKANRAYESAKGLFTRIYTGGMDLLSKSYDRARVIADDVINDKLPKGAKMLSDFYLYGKDQFNKLISTPIDIYVKGDNSPKLLAIVMRGGGYFDQITGKKIYDPGDIAGTVVNHAGEVVLTIEDIRAGLVDSEGNPIRTLSQRVQGYVKEGLSRGIKFTKEMAKKGLDALGPAGKKISDLLGKAGDAFSSLFTLKNLTVKGDIKLYGNIVKEIMKEANLTQTTIKDNIPSDKLDPTHLFSNINTNISPEMIDKYKDKFINRYTSVKDTLVGLVKGKKEADKKSIQEADLDMSDVLDLDNTAIKNPYKFNKKEKEIKTSGKKLKQPLTLKEKLERSRAFNDIDGDGKRDGNWQDQIAKNKEIDAAREKDIQEKRKVNIVDRYASGGSAFANSLGLLKGGLDKVREIFSGMSEADLLAIPNKDLSAEQRQAKAEALKKKRAQLKAARAKKLAIQNGAVKPGIFSRAGGAIKNAAGTAVGGAYKALPAFAKASNAIGKKVPLGTGIVKGAGMLGRGAIGAGKMAGGLLFGGGRAAMLGRAALMAGDVMLTGGVGTALASTGLGSAIVGGAGTVLGGIGAVLASPVFLTGAALAGLGYLGYKAYKYNKRNDSNKLTDYRLAQYGVLGLNKEYHRIFELEETLLPAIVYVNGQATIDSKRLDVSKVLSIFDISEDQTDRVEAFLVWMQNRFKPVYCSYLTAMKKLGIKKSINELDSLELEIKKQIITVTDIPSAYSVMDSPFTEPDKLSAGSSEVMKAKTAALDEMEKRPRAKVSGTVKAVAGLEMDSKNEDGTVKRVRRTTEEINAEKNKGFMNKLGNVAMWLNPITAPFVIPAKIAKAFAEVTTSVGKWLGHNVSPIEAVRFKAYGLKDFPATKVNAIRNLEEYVSKNIKVSNGKEIKFEGNVENVISEVGSKFGVPATFSKNAENFMKWFKDRFLPVFLKYISYGASKANRLDVSKLDEVLTDSEKYQVALDIQGMNIWSESASPFKYETEMALDSKILDENINLLKSKAKDNKLPDPKKPVSNSTIKAPANAPVPSNTPPVQNLFSNNSKPIKEDNTGDGVPPSSMQSPKGATAAGIPLAKGKYLDGSNANKYLQLANGAHIDDLNPEVRKNLLGMIEEYGTLTGKSVLINSGARTTEEQKREYAKDPSKAAKPGYSMHEYGMAIDINGKILDEMEKMGLMRKYGFTRPVGGEDWHMEPAAIQGKFDAVKSNSELASQLAAASLGLGGGGYGTLDNSIKRKRDNNYAAALLNQGLSTTANTTVKDTDKSTDRSTTYADTRNQLNDFISEDRNKANKKTNNPIQQAFTDNPQPTNTKLYTPANTDGEAVPGSKNQLDGFMNETTDNSPEAIKKAIADAAKITGVDPNLLMTIAAIESSLNPNARANGTSAKGLFGFLTNTWDDVIKLYGKKYGISSNASPTDAKVASLMAGEYIKANMKQLKSVVKNPGAVEAYLAHLLGPNGAKKFLSSDGDDVGATVLPSAAAKNKAIFYENGNTNRPRSVDAIYDIIENKINTKSKAFGITPPEGTPPEFTNKSIYSSSSTNNVPEITDVKNYSSTDTTKPSTTTPTITSKPTPKIVPDRVSQRTEVKAQAPAIEPSVLFSKIDETNKLLTASLEVEKDMLTGIKSLITNTDPTNLAKIIAVLTKSNAPATPTQSAPLVKAGIDNRRTVS